MPVIQLTESVVKNLTCPADKKRCEWVDADAASRGLYILTTFGSDIKTFFIRLKINGKSKHFNLGRTTQVSLLNARKKARLIRAEVAQGNDPGAAIRARKAMPTLSEFFHDQYLPQAKVKKRSWIRDVQLFVRIEKRFGHYKLDALTRKEATAFHVGLLDEELSPASCNHHLRLLRHLMYLALEWEIISKNPLARVRMLEENNKLDRSLKPEQLQRLLSVLNTNHNRPACQAFLWLLSTGARCGEAIGAKWSHIDREMRTWRIPAANSKSKRVRSVPLNDTAMEILDGLGTEKHPSGHLFISSKHNEPFTDLSKAWQIVRIEAGLPKCRLHDLRHTFASTLVSSGESLYAVTCLLGHADGSTAMRYSTMSSASLQQATNAVSNRLREAMQGNSVEKAAA